MGGQASAAAPSTVVIAYSEPNLASVAKRIRAELHSAGRKEVIVEQRTPLGSCSSRPALDGVTGQIGVVLRIEGAGIVGAEICTNPRPNQVTVVTARGQLDEEEDFAIVVTEALHGMLVEPRTAAAEKTAVKAPPEEKAQTNEPEESMPGRASLAVQSRLALDAPTGDFWMGVVPMVEIPLSGSFRFGAEMFIGLRPIEYSDDTIDLKSHLIWARFGVMMADSFGPVLLGWNVSGGFYANRATADAVAPRLGGSDGTFGGILAVSGYAQWPAEGRLFLSGSLGVSTLLPRLNYQLSDDVTPELGIALLEGGLGLGLRLGR